MNSDFLPNGNSSSAVISMQNVCKSYPDFSLTSFNLYLPKGEVLGIIGPNGAGKSTCLRLIMGFVKADSGQITVLGKDIVQQIVQIKQEVAYVAEDMRLFGSQTLVWHMQFVASIFTSWDQAYANRLLRGFNLNPNQKIKTLSLGQRIKATLLLALARRPKILVLDEPSTGLDPVARHELTNELFELMLNEDHSVILSSQHTQDVERISDSIVFLDKGKLISYQDKESYLEQWRRIELEPNAAIPLPRFSDIVNIEKYSHMHVITHSHFSHDHLEKYLASGFKIQSLKSMNLEDIFINQVLHNRAEVNNHA